MAEQSFKYTTVSAPSERIVDLDSNRVERGAPTAVHIECTSCGNVWNYRVQLEGIAYAPVTCPGCGKTEPYAGHIPR